MRSRYLSPWILASAGPHPRDVPPRSRRRAAALLPHGRHRAAAAGRLPRGPRAEGSPGQGARVPRVHPGEIEVALVEHPAIREAVVTAGADADGETAPRGLCRAARVARAARGGAPAIPPGPFSGLYGAVGFVSLESLPRQRQWQGGSRSPAATPEAARQPTGGLRAATKSDGAPDRRRSGKSSSAWLRLERPTTSSTWAAIRCSPPPRGRDRGGLRPCPPARPCSWRPRRSPTWRQRLSGRTRGSTSRLTALRASGERARSSSCTTTTGAASTPTRSPARLDPDRPFYAVHFHGLDEPCASRDRSRR